LDKGLRESSTSLVEIGFRLEEVYVVKWRVDMGLQDIEMTIFNCPHTASKECDARLSCHPIPGCGPLDPEFIVLGINPARRGGVWSRYDRLEELKHRYLIECKKPQYSYGKFLGRLERLVPQFRIPQTVYLTDIVRCPTRQGLPPSGMIEQCVSAYMKKTLQVLHPQYIISLGRHPSIYVGGFFSGNVVRSRRIKIDEHDYWVIAVPHPSRANAEAIASTVSQIIDVPRSGFAVESGQVSYLLKNEEMGNVIMRKLMDYGYKKIGRSSWIKESHVVKVVRSSEFRRRIRIRWEEEWKDNHAIIYDYSSGEGPVCVVPANVFFRSAFVREKRKSNAYQTSQYLWSQTFPRDHDLARLVLSFESRWDIL